MPLRRQLYLFPQFIILGTRSKSKMLDDEKKLCHTLRVASRLVCAVTHIVSRPAVSAAKYEIYGAPESRWDLHTNPVYRRK